MDKFSEMDNIEDELDEIFESLIDFGYKMNISSYYTDQDFNHVSPRILKKIDFYYHGFEIFMKREVSQSNSHNWNGSIYYEDDISLLNDLKNSIGRLKNHYPDYKIYYAIRNMNQIDIRIVIGSVENETPYDYEKLMKFIDSLRSKIEILDSVRGNYNFKLWSSSLEGSVSNKSIIIGVSKTKYEKILKSNKSNKNDFFEILDLFKNEISFFFEEEIETISTHQNSKGHTSTTYDLTYKTYKQDEYSKKISILKGDLKILDLEIIIDEPTSIKQGFLINKKTFEIYPSAILKIKVY